jgi:hypothetical protein
MHRPEVSAASERLVCRFRLSQRTLAVDMHEGVHKRVHGLDARQRLAR